MQQKENISKLLERYILNECSEEEIRAVISFFKSETNSNDIPSVEDVLHLLKENKALENVSFDLPFKDILKTAKEKKQVTFFNRNEQKVWPKYISIAAIFIVAITSGYIFLQNQSSNNSIIIPEDAITLELEDGSIHILNEDGSKKVLDKNGNVIGQQVGGQIAYEKTNSTTEETLVYNRLTVPYGKRFDLKLSDGTMVNLNAGTSLKYPVKFLDGQIRKVYLEGEAFFGVSRDSLHPFVVNADELEIRVLGTKFNISSYPEDNRADVVLVEGSVAMHKQTEKFDKNKNTVLVPGFKGTFQKNNGKINTSPVVIDIYTAWIKGELVFRNMNFENILKKLERHYDITVTNNNKVLAKEIFNASYGKVSLFKILEDLRLTHNIEYSIDKTNITIH